jgi:hypothetical protein
MLDIYLKHDVSDVGFCLHLQVKFTHLGPIDKAILCLRTQAVEVEVTLQLTVSQSVCLGLKHTCCTCDQTSCWNFCCLKFAVLFLTRGRVCN